MTAAAKGVGFLGGDLVLLLVWWLFKWAPSLISLFFRGAAPRKNEGDAKIGPSQLFGRLGKQRDDFKLIRTHCMFVGFKDTLYVCWVRGKHTHTHFAKLKLSTFCGLVGNMYLPSYQLPTHWWFWNSGSGING